MVKTSWRVQISQVREKPEKFLSISECMFVVFDITSSDFAVILSALAYLFWWYTQIGLQRFLLILRAMISHAHLCMEDMLVFASDGWKVGRITIYTFPRDGDLAGRACEFGPNINSPLVLNTGRWFQTILNFSNRLMIFSSNRPGRFGEGFWFVLCGIPKFWYTKPSRFQKHGRSIFLTGIIILYKYNNSGLRIP